MEDTLIEFKTANLAKEKEFKPKTVSTSWTFKSLLGEGKLTIGALMNLQCQSNLLNEIQKWLREVHKIQITIDPIYNEEGTEIEHYEFMVFTNNKSKTNALLDRLNGSYDKYKTYEQALEEGLQTALKLIK